ncbi:MFS transporter, partial [Streptomyces sp. NPDC049577]|uniref:MFS transporter n=1 Tax=Streptomyces sp. NPDC049577 TaxID=3155153 RepID=UPI003431902E
YLHGFAVFTVASAACALAPSLGVLIGCRVAQAAGAALLQANSVALVTTSAPRVRLRTALGVQAAAQAVGLALGPTVGGALVAAYGWRPVFALNVPVGLLALAAGHYLLPRTRERDGARAGAGLWGPVLLAVATTGLLLGLSTASAPDVPAWRAVVPCAAAAAGGWGLVVHLRRSARPLVDPALLRRRAVAAGLAGALCNYLVLFGPLVLVPMAIGRAGGSSELAVGLVLTALPAGFALAATGADRVLPRRLSGRARCVLGALVCVVALAGTAAACPGGSRPLPTGPALLGLGLLGLGLGVCTPANNALIMAAVPASAAGTGGGLVNMARGLGTALGIALVALALQLTGDPRWAVLPLLVAALLAMAAAWPGSPPERPGAGSG